ncbi:MAG: hypothetical protein ACJA13_002304 [Paraglaciecola sp.]|jgi:hypothetical protein
MALSAVQSVCGWVIGIGSWAFASRQSENYGGSCTLAKPELCYVLLALLFAAGMFHFVGAKEGYQFITGYLIEKSLSIDNIFVFVLIFTDFSVPQEYQ